MENYKITEHFTYYEMVNSTTAKSRGIDNTPNKNELANITRLCKEVLEPIRQAFGDSLIVSSGFRCAKLNAAVGGSKTSQHMVGQAADIHTKSDKPADNKKLFDLIAKMVKEGKIVVGQLIDEYSYNWVHVSLPTTTKKNQILHLK